MALAISLAGWSAIAQDDNTNNNQRERPVPPRDRGPDGSGIPGRGEPGRAGGQDFRGPGGPGISGPGMPGGPGGQGFGGPGGQGGSGFGMRGGFVSPIISALDTNNDGVIDEKEIENATAALKKLDKNGDGKLTMDELRPNRQDMRGPGGQGGQGGRPPGNFDGNRRGPDGVGGPDGGPQGNIQGGQRGPDGRGGPDRPPSDRTPGSNRQRPPVEQ